MNLIDVYIQEVTRRLPEKNREDIALELRSTIEEMLPDHYSEEDVKSALQKMGDPVVLASGYRDQPMHLIGPRYFDIYVSLLKMILPIAAVVAFISVIAEYISGFNDEEAIINVVLDIIGFGIWRIIEVGIQTFFWFTIVLAVIERVDKDKDSLPLSAAFKKWTPDDLKNISYIPKQKAISKYEMFFCLMWTAIWATLYFYANQLIGIYEGGKDGLTLAAPAFNQEILLQYWPIVAAIIVFEIALTLYKFINGQWTKRLAIINAIHELIVTVTLTIILLTPNILTPEFVAYKASFIYFDTWLIAVIIIIFIIFAVINAVNGFRKARTTEKE
ncbi:HAAS signaling domain-containing protein [Bacillus sp. S/N-304-OC-R1]|uniref:HAAS signaling domain-containing protein n=1 Tax=Bacillus sp. S/N-304-OC-R1 TaxID=2758034 RepID=UPI001C8F03A3|nr:hypothetical protein [Bacillus sp. S/N-304-OC-R1]MBY0123774.1 hypothetical protein [Bacillus sp. S/N-304-OC-R1]